MGMVRSITGLTLPCAYHWASSFIIDAKGLVKQMHAGYKNGDERKLAAEIDALLGR